MNSRTRRNMAQVLNNEFLSSARVEVLAKAAERDGHSGLARALRAVAVADGLHATRTLALMRGKIGSLDEEMAALFRRKGEEAESGFPAMMREAEDEGRRMESVLFDQFRQVAVNHKALLENADREDAEYHVCAICGFIAEGEVPERCPVCTAVSERFRKID